MSTNDAAGSAGAHRANGSNEQDTGSSADTAPEVAALQADIERTRADLADTVDQLTAKLDVKTRVRESVTDAKGNAAAQVRRLQDRATDVDGRPTPATLGIGGGVLVAAVVVVVIVLVRRNNAPRRTRRRR